MRSFENYRLWSARRLMQRLSSSEYLRLGHISAELASQLKEGVTPENAEDTLKQLKGVRTKLERLDMRAALGGLDWLIKLMEDDIPSYPTFDSYRAIMECGFAELDSKTFLYLGENEGYFDSDTPFGSGFSDKFPESIEDVDNASNCIAVGQYTACVFHLMRAMESCVQNLCETLSIKNNEVEWGKLLSAMDGKIKLMSKSKEKRVWSEVRANLYHVKECWRNSTMHPKQTYTEEEAKAVFLASKSFVLSFLKLET